MDAHHVRGEEVDRLAQHARLGLDSADAPAHDAQAVDHRRVRVGAHQRVRVPRPLGVAQEALGEELKVDLVDDPDPRGHDLEGFEGLHSPLEELVALAVAHELHVEVLRKGVGAPREVHLHRMVDDQVDRDEGLDHLRLPAHPGYRGAHGREVDEERHAGEVLEDDAGDHKGDLLGPGRLRLPGGQGANGVLGHPPAVAVSKEGFQDDADRHRKPRDIEARLRERGKRMEPLPRPVGVEGLERGEGVVRVHHRSSRGVIWRPPP